MTVLHIHWRFSPCTSLHATGVPHLSPALNGESEQDKAGQTTTGRLKLYFRDELRITAVMLLHETTNKFTQMNWFGQ